MSAATLIEKLDDHGKPAWIALLVFSFIVFWPAGLALLAYMIWSGRMGCWGHHAGGDRWQSRMGRLQAKMERMQEKANRWYGRHQPQSSGNHAFDNYREETLRRLEDEQREFFDFLERLRHAKDKQEFDQFMSDRGRRRDEPPPAPSA